MHSKDYDHPLHPWNLGPVVQSVVSLTSLLRVISLTVLYIYVSVHNILIFFAEKMWVAFKQLTFFSKKFQHICVSLDVNFNELLTNNIVSFEQLGPDCSLMATQRNTVDSHYLEVQGTLWNTSRYPNLDISPLFHILLPVVRFPCLDRDQVFTSR